VFGGDGNIAACATAKTHHLQNDILANALQNKNFVLPINRIAQRTAQFSDELFDQLGVE
jgi:hypothetical protein